ncbi:uncharacterized protein LOC135698763 [Ochlerotatus camptorhynchus]|uniref:uncharacterized protein LOC135698763 n=1 Tax=Ochlerotatus camptorhynchus TaxID=644619 RepID=UPI0031D9BEB2
MAAISKHWNEIVHSGVTCATLSHPGKTCHDHLRYQMRATIGGNLKFFIPISIVRLFMLCYTKKTMSVEIVLQALFELVSESFNGWAVSNCWSAGFCGMYHWFGGFINNYSVSLPGLPGTLLMFFMPAYVKMSHSRAMFNVFLECWMKSREHPLFEYARESKVIGTLAFMAMSAAIGYYAQRTKAVEFWFFSPLKKNLNPEQDRHQKLCLHRNTCQNYILDGMKTCFTFGFLMELVRKLINVAPRIRKHPSAILEAFARIRFKFVAFLTMYNGLFRLITCLLARHRKRTTENDSTLAGFLSGITYGLSPNYNVFNLGVAAVIQNVWNYITEKYAKVAWIQWVNKLSFSSIVWMVLMNYNMYGRAYYPYAMSKFAMKFTDLCSGQQAQVAAECLGKAAMGFS